jgi:hypothetical protein
MGPAVRPLLASATSSVLRHENEKWLGEEGSNPHYQGQNLASYH